MRNKKSGFSITELVIGGVILLGAIAAALQLFLKSHKTQNDAQKRLQLSNLSNLFSGHLQKNMSSSDVKFLGFTGNPAPERSLMRALYPLQGRCADLSTANCANDAAIVFIDYNKTTAPAVTGICHFQDAVDDYIIIDSGNSTFGNAAFASPDFNVVAGTGYASGRLPLGVGSLLALLSAPNASVWRVKVIPTANVTMAAPGVFQAGGLPVPANCVANFRPNTEANYLSALYLLKIEPWILKNATGGAVVSLPDRANALGSFPMRLFQAKPRTIGRLPINAQTGSLVLLDCTVPNADGSLACPNQVSSSLMNIEGVSRLEIEMAFVLSFYQGTVELPATRFQFLNAGGIDEAQAYLKCPSPTCHRLTWSSPLQVLGLSTSGVANGETFDKLNADHYSQLKIEALKRLQFTFFDKDKKETSFNVLF